MTDTLYRAISSEKYKLAKNKEIFGILLIPVALIVLIDGYLIYEANKSGFIDSATNPWKILLGRYVFQFFQLLYPILVAIFVHACCDIEYKNNNYKILFTIPLSKTKIFFSKALFVLFIVLLSVILSYLAFLASGYLLSLMYPKIGFQNYDYREVIFCTFLKLVITLTAVSMIQLSLSLAFKNFIYPIGFCVFMTVFSIMVAQKKFSDFIPYKGAYNSFANIMSENSSFERLDYSNIAMTILFLSVSFFLFRQKKVA
ncbi:ABC transporter permease [Parapedobacter sp. GCM10030251]|uniref:ABC transporter permease n=1 Tax=Parapedobacter sp. GCM10030251 TaxID=3273419 RepID=UPI003619F778